MCLANVVFKVLYNGGTALVCGFDDDDASIQAQRFNSNSLSSGQIIVEFVMTFSFHPTTLSVDI